MEQFNRQNESYEKIFINKSTYNWILKSVDLFIRIIKSSADKISKLNIKSKFVCVILKEHV